MEQHKGIKAVSAKGRKEWRRWLEKNHASAGAVWLVIYHKSSTVKSVYYDEAVEEALCFGWIDAVANARDHESKYQYFTKRKPKSNWSKLNRERVERLIEQNLMTDAGMQMVELAKKTGTWEALETVQSLDLPADLAKALDKNKTAKKHFQAFTPSSKRIILEWIFNAKRPETRKKRVEETVALATQNIKANHYRQ